MKKYYELRQEQQKRVDAFPLGAAFSEKQFIEMKEKLNVKDNKELLSIGGGCFIRKTDQDEFDKIFEVAEKEREEFFKDPAQLKDAFIYELGNHEFCITYDYEPALTALGLDYDNLSGVQKDILREAKNEYLNSIYPTSNEETA